MAAESVRPRNPAWSVASRMNSALARRAFATIGRTRSRSHTGQKTQAAIRARIPPTKVEPMRSAVSAKVCGAADSVKATTKRVIKITVKP
jgi:hypothetical protein